VGRNAKSDELKRAQGNPGEKKLEQTVAAAPEVHEEFPAPEHLSDVERQIWNREIRRVGNLNLLRQSDMSAFEMYVETVKRYQEAKAIIDVDGLTYTVQSKHGTYTRRRPELDVESNCRRMMRDMQREFGMTSISRIRAHSVVAATRQPEQPVLPLQGGGDRAQAPLRPDSPLGILRTAGNA
jgi:P27 family predicted phage terminase small subunit